jgi:RsiW-degrading membrane proteinase PrsW (M82 family)
MTLKICICIFGALAWLVSLMRIDVYAKKRQHHAKLTIFFLAGLASLPFSFKFYDFCEGHLIAPQSEISPFLYDFGIVGPSEELAKFIIFLVIARLLRTHCDPLICVLQGAAVGVGFALVENFAYAIECTKQGMVFRAIFCTALHSGLTAISAFAYGARSFYKERDWGRATWWFVPVGLFISAYLHGAIDFLVFKDDPWYQIIIMFDIAIGAGLALVLSRTRFLSPYYGHPLRDYEKAAFEEAVRRTASPLPRAMQAFAESLQANQSIDALEAESMKGLDKDQRAQLKTVLRKVGEQRKQTLQASFQCDASFIEGINVW